MVFWIIVGESCLVYGCAGVLKHPCVNTHTTRFENTSTHSLSDKTLPTLSMITRTFVLLIKESIRRFGGY